VGDGRKFPSSAHAGGPTRIEGFEAFGQVFPMWGTTPFYLLFEFSVPVPTAANVEMARKECDADTLIQAVGVFFTNANRLFISQPLLEINGAVSSLPSVAVPLFSITNGFFGLFPLDLFLKKNSVLRILAPAGWVGYQDENTRPGIVVLKGWTFA
jgi:hypothetical protein